MPTSGAALYEYKDEEWNKVYEERLTEKEEKIIEKVMRDVAKETGLLIFLNLRGASESNIAVAEVTMSALGQNAPVAEKEAWDPDHSKRHMLQEKIAATITTIFGQNGRFNDD